MTHVSRLLRYGTALLLSLAGSASPAAEYFERYDLAPNPVTFDLGVQPNAYPLAFIGALLQRDRILQRELAATGVKLRTFPFTKGNDMVNLVGNGKLEAALLGDMPTITTAMRTPLAIVGLTKRNFSSIVSRKYTQVVQLKGKRVGYSAGSSSHYVLLVGLEAAGLSERDVTLVPLEPTQMPDALGEGLVDAFSAWEPTPSISLSRDPKNRLIYRAISTDWMVMSKTYIQERRAESMIVTAAYIRAINWMKADGRHAERAAQWALADRRAFLPKSPEMTVAQAVSIVRKDMLDVAGLPGVPALIDGVPPLTREFAFLARMGKIPAVNGEERLRAAMAWDGLEIAQKNPKRFRLFEYDYDLSGSVSP